MHVRKHFCFNHHQLHQREYILYFIKFIQKSPRTVPKRLYTNLNTIHDVTLYNFPNFWNSHLEWKTKQLIGPGNYRELRETTPKITKRRPQDFSVNGSIICSGLRFWHHFDVNGSIIFGGLHFLRHWFNMAKILSNFGEQQLVTVNYACGFNQSETGKYFEWIIIKLMPPAWHW